MKMQRNRKKRTTKWIWLAEDFVFRKKRNNDFQKKNLEMLLLATACEWMYYADDMINNGLEKSGTPIPSAFRDVSNHFSSFSILNPKTIN